MKKLFALFLILLFLPVLSLAEYKPALNMTMDDFITKYNALPSALGSPYNALSFSWQWSSFQDYQVAWFYPIKDKNVIIWLLSKDKTNMNTTKAGLDAIQIYSSSTESFVPLISITARCTDLFSTDLLGSPMGEIFITKAIRLFYENNYKEKNMMGYYPINTELPYLLSFFYSDGGYCFQIYVDE